ncbi:MAG TPA: hypothetical protein ENN99_02315 [Chloroflexi bacterium]|nr:hypothetical protein [Chloroflexota bacterium]
MQGKEGRTMERFAKLGITSIGLALLLALAARHISLSAEGVAPTDFGLLHASSPDRAGYTLSSEGVWEATFASGAKHTSPSASEEWQPYPIYGGEMTSIAMGSVITEGTLHIETVYVGTRDAGVFKSSDGGQSWEPARTGLTFYPIRTLVTDPQNPHVLYAGTDYDGIWKSTDGGDTWFESGSGLDRGLIVFDIEIDPQDTDTLYAGLAGGVALAIGNIYNSEDGGATWTIKDAGLPRSSETSSYTNGILTLALDPDDPARLYAGTVFDGAFVTTDGGEAWTPISEGLPYLSYPDWFREVSSLAIDPHHGNRVAAIAGGKYHVWDDINGWEKVSDDTLSSESHLYFHPADPAILYCPNRLHGFSKSADGGVNWEHFRAGIFDVAFHTLFPDTLYGVHRGDFNEIGGVYKSDDQGETWSEAYPGVMAQAVQSVVVDPQDSDRMYAGTGNGHFFRTQDGGITWERGLYESYKPLYNFGAVKDLAVDPLDSHKIYLVGSSGLFTSTNYGAVLEKIEALTSPNCMAVSIKNSSTQVYVGGGLDHGVYRSVDGGSTWDQITETLPVFGSSTCPVLSIAVDPDNPDTVWVGMQYGGGIARSTDGGDHWQVMGLTETNFIEAIAINPANSAEILAGGGFWEGSIYKSTDGGGTWEKISGIAFVQDLVYDPRDPRWVYAATEGYGVLRSFDGGENWHDYSSGIFYPLLYSLAITEEDPPLLVVGSYGSGLYWSHLSAPTYVFLPLVVR